MVCTPWMHASHGVLHESWSMRQVASMTQFDMTSSRPATTSVDIQCPLDRLCSSATQCPVHARLNMLLHLQLKRCVCATVLVRESGGLLRRYCLTSSAWRPKHEDCDPDYDQVSRLVRTHGKRICHYRPPRTVPVMNLWEDECYDTYIACSGRAGNDSAEADTCRDVMNTYILVGASYHPQVW